MMFAIASEILNSPTKLPRIIAAIGIVICVIFGAKTAARRQFVWGRGKTARPALCRQSHHIITFLSGILSWVLIHPQTDQFDRNFEWRGFWLRCCFRSLLWTRFFFAGGSNLHAVEGRNSKSNEK